jgi:MFS family permease
VTSALPYSNSNASWGERVIMLLGGLPAALALMGLTSVLPKIDTALAHSPHDSFLVKQLIGAVGLAMVVGAPAAGFLVHRLGLRNLLVASLGIYVVAGTAGLYISDLTILLTTRLCLGLAAAAFQIMSMTLINVRLRDTERASWMGRHIAFAMIGTIFFHPIAGMLGDITWRGYHLARSLRSLYFAVIVIAGRIAREPCVARTIFIRNSAKKRIAAIDF